MPYTLISASTLGLDLARCPGGAEAAGVLATVLTRGRQVEAALADRRLVTAADRELALRVLGPDLAISSGRAAGAPSPVLSPGATAAGPAAAPDALARTLRTTLAGLRQVRFGGVADVLALARLIPPQAWLAPDGSRGREGLGVRTEDATHAADAVADRVAAALLRAHPSAGPAAHALADRLGAAWDDAADLVPPVAAVVAEPVGVPRLLAAVTAAPPAALRALAEHRATPTVWAQRMHEATWAVELTGRTPLAAAAQLDLVRCLKAAGVGADDLMGGVWSVCSAAVQGEVVADVLDRDAWLVLCADVTEALLPAA